MQPEDVRRMQQVAYVMAQTVSACAEIEAMKAANEVRFARAEAQAYPEEAFREVPNRFGLGHNDVLTTLRQGEIPAAEGGEAR